MRSLQLIEYGQPLEWREQPTPEPQGREVLLETVAAGVCHSDLHFWEGYYELGGGKRTYVKDRGVTLPLTLGHEIVGRVVAKGPDATGVEDGDVRLVYPWIGCGECRHCQADNFHMCSRMRSLGVFSHGGFADHVLVPDAHFLVDIGDLPPESTASYACAGLTAYSAIRKTLPLAEDETLVLIGAGGLGLMAAQFVGEITPARVDILDIDDRKLEAARQFGDFITINSRETDAREEILRLTDKRGVGGVIDFVGSTQTAELGFSVLAKNGTLVVVGLFGGELTLPLPTLPMKNAVIRGSYTGSLAELKDLVSLAQERGLQPLPVACHPLEATPRILEEIREGRIVGRAVVQPAGVG